MTYNNNQGYPPAGAPAPYGAAPAQGPKDGGYLYPNDKKVRAEQPDQKGKIKIGEDLARRIMAGEREFYLSGWNKADNKGGRFLSVKMKGIDAQAAPQGGYAVQQRPQAPAPQQQAPRGYAPQPQWQQGPSYPQPLNTPQYPDDEIPF